MTWKTALAVAHDEFHVAPAQRKGIIVQPTGPA
jgi:hypothetical protein